MVKRLKFAVVSAIFLLPFAYSHSAHSRNHSLSYQEAVWMCGTGNLQACDVRVRDCSLWYIDDSPGDQ
jgi:hypothetical protein